MAIRVVTRDGWVTDPSNPNRLILQPKQVTVPVDDAPASPPAPRPAAAAPRFDAQARADFKGIAEALSDYDPAAPAARRALVQRAITGTLLSTEA